MKATKVGTPGAMPCAGFHAGWRKMLSKSLLLAYRDFWHPSDMETFISAWEFLASKDARLWSERVGLAGDPRQPLCQRRKITEKQFGKRMAI